MKGIPFKAPIAVKSINETKEGRRFVAGFAATTDIDRENEMFSKEALQEAAKDLIKTTLLFNHNPDKPIGRIEEAKAEELDGKMGLFIKASLFTPKESSGEFAKLANDIWEMLQQGTIGYFSVKGLLEDYESRLDKTRNKLIKVLKKVKLYEVSLVSLPENPEAKVLSYFIEKAILDFSRKGKEEKEMEEMRDEVLNDEKENKEVEKRQARYPTPGQGYPTVYGYAYPPGYGYPLPADLQKVLQELNALRNALTELERRVQALEQKQKGLEVPQEQKSEEEKQEALIERVAEKVVEKVLEKSLEKVEKQLRLKGEVNKSFEVDKYKLLEMSLASLIKGGES
jgi:HK97 family phage prohead protease